MVFGIAMSPRLFDRLFTNADAQAARPMDPSIICIAPGRGLFPWKIDPILVAELSRK